MRSERATARGVTPQAPVTRILSPGTCGEDSRARSTGRRLLAARLERELVASAPGEDVAEAQRELCRTAERRPREEAEDRTGAVPVEHRVAPALDDAEAVRPEALGERLRTQPLDAVPGLLLVGGEADADGEPRRR